MKYVLLMMACSVSLLAQAFSTQIDRPYNRGSYGQAQLYRQGQQPYRQGYVQFQSYEPGYYNPYYNPYYTPYQPDNGPMRGRNSIQGHQRNFYYP